jgi:hypothetical protein
MEWAVALVALALIGVATVSGRPTGTPITPACCSSRSGWWSARRCSTGSTSRARGRRCAPWRRQRSPWCCSPTPRASTSACCAGRPTCRSRLLGLGLPLTQLRGAAAAAAVFGELAVEEAVILAVVLAPTDAELGQAVVTEPRVPARIRQGLNVESGLNDGSRHSADVVSDACAGTATRFRGRSPPPCESVPAPLALVALRLPPARCSELDHPRGA